MQTIYVDELCLLNFLVNFLLLLATSRLSGLHIRPGRLALAALLGAAYAVLTLLPAFGWTAGVLVKLAAAFLMCLTAFGGAGRLVRSTLLFLGLSFGFGGAVYALGLWRYGAAELSSVLLYAPASLRLLLSAGALCLGIFLLVFGQLARHGGLKRDLLSVRLTCGTRSVRLTALLDTGSSLTDPLTGLPVLVAEYETLLPLLPASLHRSFTAAALRSPASLMESLAETEISARLRLIPYCAVGTAGGLLLGLRTEQASIGQTSVSGLVAAFSPTPLSDGGTYRALIGPSAIEKRRHLI